MFAAGLGDGSGPNPPDESSRTQEMESLAFVKGWRNMAGERLDLGGWLGH